jgi:phage shock protein A
MSIIDRILSIFRGSANKALSKLETPENLAEQAQMELEKNVKDLTGAVTAALTTQKQLESQIQKDQGEIANWEKRAAMAVQANNDDIAKQCLERKQTHKQNLESLTAQLEEQKKTMASLKRQHGEAEEKLRQFNIKKQGMVARAKAAENQAKANEIMSGTGGSSMDKLEEKIRDREIRNEAVNELSGRGKLDEQFKDLDKNIEVADELAALKARVASQPGKAIAASDVKLIVANDGGQKPVVDDNLPMVVDVEVSDGK